MKPIKNIPFVIGVVIAFFFTAYISIFTNALGVLPGNAVVEKFVFGTKMILLLMMSIMVFTIPGLIIYARRVAQR